MLSVGVTTTIPLSPSQIKSQHLVVIMVLIILPEGQVSANDRMLSFVWFYKMGFFPRAKANDSFLIRWFPKMFLAQVKANDRMLIWLAR